MTPSHDAPKVYEISDISSSHMADTEEDIRIYDIDEKPCGTSMQTFSSDSSIINFVHSLSVISPRKGEEFDFSPSNIAAGVQISNTLDILEKISDCRSDPFSLLDLDLPANPYRIACTIIHNFEKGENCASTVSVDHTFGSDMKLFGSDMTLFRSDLILFGSNFRFQGLSVLLVAALTNFGVKNQVPQVFFKFVVGDLMLVSSYEVADIVFLNHWLFQKLYHIM